MSKRNKQQLPERQEPKSPVVWRRHGGFQLQTLDDAWRFATAVAKSGLAPKGLDTPEKILIAMQMGAELGMPPLASLQNIAVINGRPFLTADLMLAVCRSSGLFDEAAFQERIEHRDGVPVAICQVRRKPDGKPIVREFSLEDAKRAGLLRQNTPWSQYPLRMLQMRARSWALRDAFSDILKGMRAAEDVDDWQEVEAEIVESQPEGKLTVNVVLDQLAETIGRREPEDNPPQSSEQEPEQDTESAPEELQEQQERQRREKTLL